MSVKLSSMERALLAAGALALAVLFLAAGCGKRERPDTGTIKDGVYENRFFNFSMRVPEGWQVQDTEARKKFLERGREMSAGEQSRVQRVLEEAEEQTLNLLMVFQHPLGSTNAYNPGFLVVAEKLADGAPIEKGTDYLTHARRVMELTGLPYEFGAVSSESIGGRNFGVMDVEVHVGKPPVRQKYYATIIKGHALVFILSYKQDQEHQAQKQALESVRFG